MNRILFLAIIIVVITAPVIAQDKTGSDTTPKWEYTHVVDELTDKNLNIFTLSGIYDITPSHIPSHPPSLQVVCSNGKLLKATLNLNAVATSSGKNRLTGIPETAVIIRTDQKKPDNDFWEISNDGTALFLAKVQLDKVLTGSMIGHPSDHSKLTHRVLISVTEAFANQILVRLNMPDNSDDLVLKCGLEYDHKREKELESEQH